MVAHLLYFKGLLHAADLLQLHDVRDVCCDFLQTQLNPMNCLNVKTLISLYGCEEYLLSFKSYIQQNFTYELLLILTILIQLLIYNSLVFL